MTGMIELRAQLTLSQSCMKYLVPAALAAALCASPALANCLPVSGGLPGWERLDFDDIAPNAWAEDGGSVVGTSRASASMLYTSIPATTAPILSWRWRVDSPVPATDLTRKGGDDRSFAMTVGFAYDPANATLGERMKRVVVENVAGADAPGRILDFVWGGNQPVGTRIQSPYSGSSGRMVIQRTGTANGWQTERVDLGALYREAWGTAPPPATRIALFLDTDDTGGTGMARIADICFSAS